MPNNVVFFMVTAQVGCFKDIMFSRSDNRK